MYLYYLLNFTLMPRENIVDLSDRSKWLERVYSARNNKELAKGYAEWAENYDQDVLSFGYKIPAIMTGLIGRYITPYRIS